MTNKTIELDYNSNLDQKLISKIGNPFKFDNPAMQDIMNKFYNTDTVVVNKKILVIRMYDMAVKYAENNSVIYITDNKEKYDKFLELINNEKYGGDDDAWFIEDYRNLDVEIGDMKFDIIIGNPPYAGNGNPLYLQILEKVNVNNNRVIWLCPTQWVKNFKDSKYLDNLKKNTCSNLVFHKFIGNPFDGAILANEVGIFVFGEGKKENYETIRMERFLNAKLAKSIWEKFEKFNNIGKYTRKEFNKKYYVYASEVRGNQDYSTYRPKWDWTTLFDEEKRVNFYTEKPNGHWHFWNFATINECKNFVASTETDILMFALYIGKVHNKNNEITISLIPWLGDYTHEWTETEIAKKLKLTKEEVEYIHQEMKNFGWKAASKKKD